MMERGNHKLATSPQNGQKLIVNYTKEVGHGWMLPIPKKNLYKITGAVVFPIRIAVQHTVNADGRKIMKRRTTHDVIFSPPSNLSVNNQIIRDFLEECFYLHYLLCVLHIIHITKMSHTLICIFLIKIDLDSTYRRLYVAARMALLTITILKILRTFCFAYLLECPMVQMITH